MNGQQAQTRVSMSKPTMLLAGFLVTLLCALGLFAAQPAWAQTQGQTLAPSTLQAQATQLAKGQTFKKGGITYKVIDLADDDDLPEVRLVKFAGTAKAVKVDTVTYKGQVYEVDEIGKNAFNNAKGHKITSLTLGVNVSEIRAKAFYGCSKLKTINMRKCDVIDIERGAYGYHLDDIEIGANAFKKAGVSKVKVKCGKSNADYQALFKKALEKKGMRSSVTVVK